MKRDWDPKASLFPKFLEAPAASMHCVLGGEEYEWYDEDCQESEDDEDYEGTYKEQWVGLVFHVGNYINVAVVAVFPDRSISH